MCPSCNQRPIAHLPIILGLCDICCSIVLNEARHRGDDLDEVYVWKDRRERIVAGVRLWWWRGKWRASKNQLGRVA